MSLITLQLDDIGCYIRFTRTVYSNGTYGSWIIDIKNGDNRSSVWAHKSYTSELIDALLCGVDCEIECSLRKGVSLTFKDGVAMIDRGGGDRLGYTIEVHNEVELFPIRLLTEEGVRLWHG